MCNSHSSEEMSFPVVDAARNKNSQHLDLCFMMTGPGKLHNGLQNSIISRHPSLSVGLADFSVCLSVAVGAR